MRTVSLFREQLIPAQAGKTQHQPSPSRDPMAHPRVDGENAPIATTTRPIGGSSPRGWGKPKHRGSHQLRARLIPARAGKTMESEIMPVPGRGSSPHGRGKRCITPLFISFIGLIPAWAGKTHSRRGHRVLLPAHPRMGGENTTTRRRTGQTPGSSPRGRGKRTPRRYRTVRTGLIPARAGKTWPPDSSLVSATAHPRAGGENNMDATGALGVWGSSPRGRGKPVSGRA